MQQTSNQFTINDKQWWESLYHSKKTPWDLGKAAPPLATYLKSPYTVPPGKLAVVGCGNGHDALLFAEAGHEVTGIDFSPSAIQSTLQKFEKAGLSGTRGYLLERDVFEIHEYDGYYDYVLEHCFFSSLDPARRRTYVLTVADLLKPGGKLISLWWILDVKSGPPFAMSKDEIHTLFDTKFTIDMAYVPTDSVASRRNQEFLTVMTKR